MRTQFHSRTGVCIPLTALAQKYADYENEIRVLEAKLRQEQRKNSAPSGEISLAMAQAAQRPGISRFGSFMGTRKISGPDGSLQPGASREKELEEQLVKEQTMRIAAEKKVKEVSAEIEDLSATLFEQANEMVATERKQNHELKERLQALEEQQHRQRHQQPETTMDAEKLWKENAKLKEKLHTLQQREADRKKRLERLEAANTRIDRIRTMIQPP